MSDYEARFSALQRVYGKQQAERLRTARICVIGIGGVGSWAAESLVRSGVNQLSLIDGDTISTSNINRQIHSLDATVGELKVTAMQKRIAQINPECECKAIDRYIDDDNLRELLEHEINGKQYDVVIDAIDRIKYKAAIIYCCKRNKLPIVTTGGAGGLTDPTKIQIADLTRTWNDPLAAQVRNRLRFKYGYSRNTKRSFGVPCVYSTEQQRYAKENGEVEFSKPGVAGLTLDCNYGYGSSVNVTASFGFAAAAKTIAMIIKQP